MPATRRVGVTPTQPVYDRDGSFYAGSAVPFAEFGFNGPGGYSSPIHSLSSRICFLFGRAALS